ncbi:threonine aspartase 1-like isoform 3 [Cricetulus griseus]|nr:threonine aspartase 1-like isoform 3 [Cricetulus griseus]
MTMEKGMSSGEGLPSRSPQASAAKVTVKESETRQPCEEKRGGFVLVHAGAGYHSESKAKEYKHVCKRACQKAIEKLQAGALATDAVTAALVELEVYTHRYTSWSCIQPSLYVLLVKRQKITSPKNFHLLAKGTVF